MDARAANETLFNLLEDIRQGRLLPWFVRHAAEGNDVPREAWASATDDQIMIELLRRALFVSESEILVAWCNGGPHKCDPNSRTTYNSLLSEIRCCAACCDFVRNKFGELTVATLAEMIRRERMSA